MSVRVTYLVSPYGAETPKALRYYIDRPFADDGMTDKEIDNLFKKWKPEIELCKIERTGKEK